MKKTLLVLSLALFALTLSGQREPELPPPPTTRILFVFDASKSMYGRWQSGTKIEVARQLMRDAAAMGINIALPELHGGPANAPDSDLPSPDARA